MAIESFAGLGPDAATSTGPPEYAYTIVYDYDSGGNLIYQGWSLSSPTPSGVAGWPAQTSAVPLTGPLTSLPCWAIKKVTYSVSGQVTMIQWAAGNTQQANIWDNRAALSYQ